jgi:hypothetical protein
MKEQFIEYYNAVTAEGVIKLYAENAEKHARAGFFVVATTIVPSKLNNHILLVTYQRDRATERREP